MARLIQPGNSDHRSSSATWWTTVALACIVGTATAAPTVESYAWITVGNAHSDGLIHEALVAPELGGIPGGNMQLREVAASPTYSGLDAIGSARTMQFSAQASAQGSYGLLRANTHSNLSNVFGSAQNPAYVNQDNSVNEAGVPDSFYSFAKSSFTDTLLVGPTSGIAFVRLSLHLTGTIAQDDSGIASSVVALRQTDGVSFASAQYLWFRQAEGSYDLLVQGIDIPVINGIAQFGLWLTSQSEIGLTGLDSDLLEMLTGDTMDTFADFSHTVTVDHIEAFDSNGASMRTGPLVGLSGTTYEGVGGTPVPEPAGFPLLMIALVAAGLSKRPRCKPTA
jgi:hypothetical protein